MPRFLSDLAQGVATPLWSARDAFRHTLEARTQRTKDVSALRAERDALLEELASLRRENFAARTSARDIETLRATTEGSTAQNGHILAPVLFDMRTQVLDMLVIGMGTGSGVRDRMLVTSPEGIALGYIDRAYDRSAHVRLFSSAHVTTGVVLYGTTTTQTVLEGKGAGTMTMQTPKDLIVPPGTIIGLPTLGGAAVGEVVAVESSPEDALQTIYARSPVAQHSVRYVLVDTTTVWEVPVDQPEPEPFLPQDTNQEEEE